MKSMTFRVSGAALPVLVVAVIAFNVFNLDEAYGSGAPYYSRTTNMDKWSSSLPALAAVDAFTLAAVAGYVWLWRCRRAAGRREH